MEKKKKIICYVDWTDCIAHLTGDEAYQEGETPEERSAYTRKQVNEFFEALGELKQKYDVDIHCITGGCEDYLQTSSGWIKLLHELFINQGHPDTLKSVLTEYGGDLIVGPNLEVVERPFEDSKSLINEKLCDDIRATIPIQYQEGAEVTLPYKYFANIRFENEDLTNQEFNYLCNVIDRFEGRENYELYPYYCPGYGVEIDVVPIGLDKARGVDTINEHFYKDTPKEDIALSIFNGDFGSIDLRMTNHSLTKDVLFVGSEDADIAPMLAGQSLPYMTAGHKIECMTIAMRKLAQENLELHPYDKGDYSYVK